MDWIGIERDSGFLGQRPEPLSDEDFARMAKFVKNKFGLDLTGRKAMVESRLVNYLMDRGFDSFSEYLRTIYDGGEEEAANLINRLTTNYTYFLREQEHYDHFMNTFLPAMRNRIAAGELCIWSAGCSFGNEAYTFAACMEDYFEAHGGSACDRRILATDVSRNALIAAKTGIYAEAAMQVMPAIWKVKYFTERNGFYTVNDRLRSQVVFKYHNLMQPIAFKKKFDLIVCRNVMIYFDKPTCAQLIRRFYAATNPGGYLYIGHAEAMPADTPYIREQTAVYRRDR